MQGSGCGFHALDRFGATEKEVMIDKSTLVTYLIILTGFVFIPGPSVLLTLARASSAGTRVGLATAAGIATADLVHTIMAVVGLSALLMTSAFLLSLVKYAGAAYLIHLGVRAMLEKTKSSGLTKLPKISAGTAFREAILVEVLNPKSGLFFLAFLPQFVHPQNGPIGIQLAVLGILFVVMGALSTTLVALCAGSLSALLHGSPVILRWQGKVVGTVYCALGIRLVFQEP